MRGISSQNDPATVAHALRYVLLNTVDGVPMDLSEFQFERRHGDSSFLHSILLFQRWLVSKYLSKDDKLRQGGKEGSLGNSTSCSYCYLLCCTSAQVKLSENILIGPTCCIGIITQRILPSTSYVRTS